MRQAYFTLIHLFNPFLEGSVVENSNKQHPIHLFLTALFCLLSIGVGIPSGEAANDWTMWRHDAGRSGFNQEESVLAPPLELAWTAFVDPNRNVFMESSPAIANGKLYMTTLGDSFGNPQAALYAFDLQTGQQLWSTLSLNIALTRSTAAVANGKVYVVSEDGYLYCLNAETGVLVWQTQVAPSGTPAYASPAIQDGKLYIGTLGYSSSLPKLLILNAETGTILGQKALDNSFDVYGSPVVVGNLLFVGAGGYSLENGYLLCFDVSNPLNITELWRKPLEGRAMNTPVVSNDGFVYYIPFKTPTHLYCYRADPSGAEERIYSLSGGVVWYMSPAIAYNNLYFGGADRIFYAVDLLKFHAQDPNPIRWTFGLPGNSPPMPVGSPAVANGIVYFSSDDNGNPNGAFYGLNAFTGGFVFYYTATNNGTGSSQSAPAAAENHVCFASYDDPGDGGLYCFKKKPPPGGGGGQKIPFKKVGMK